MKLIKISTNLELSVHDFPEGSIREQNRQLRALIGDGCDLYEHVKPARLYEELMMQASPTEIPGQCVSMLVDEDGLFKDWNPNLIGSYLYKTDEHRHPIMGNILFIGEVLRDGEIDFCGIDEEVFKLLERELRNMIMVMKLFKEVRACSSRS